MYSLVRWVYKSSVYILTRDLLWQNADEDSMSYEEAIWVLRPLAHHAIVYMELPNEVGT